MTLFTIAKAFTFDSSHQLEGLPEGHKCARLHGHTYTVELELGGEDLDEVGMVVDYGELKPFKAWLDSHLDHRHLNDVVDFNPTAELLACWLHGVVRELLGEKGEYLKAVRVKETANTSAEYRP